jgi:uncharacterized protein involved in exopolysaccharide biosynthesis
MGLRDEQRASPTGTILVLGGRVFRRKAFYLALVLGAGVTAVLASRTRPVYRSEAVLLYQERAGSPAGPGQREREPARRLALALEEMLFTHQRLRALIDEFHLYPAIVSKRGYAQAAEELRRRDLGFESRDGYAYRVRFEAPDPKLAQAVTARVAAVLVEARDAARRQEAAAAERFVDEEKKRAQDNLRAAEHEYAQFAAAHPELAHAGGVRTGAPVEPPARLASGEAAGAAAQDDALFGLELQALHLQERIRALSAAVAGRGSAAGGSTAPEDSALIAEREQAQAELDSGERDLAEKRTRIGADAPEVQQAETVVARAKERVRRAGQSPAQRRAPAALPLPVTADEPEVESLRRQLGSLERDIAAIRARPRPSRPLDLRRAAELGVELGTFERKVGEARERLALLEGSEIQASVRVALASSASAGELVVIDPAFLPELPVRARAATIAVIGGALAFALAFALALALVLHDDGLHAGFDVERLGLPALLVEVPRDERLAVRSARV